MTDLRLNRITGSPSSINLNDGTNYSLRQGWAPVIAPRARGLLGGLLYEPVTEVIPLRIFGITLAACLTARDNLILFLDQAFRWQQGEDLDPVLLEYRVTGSALSNRLSTEVLDAPNRGEILQLQPDFNKRIQAFEILCTIKVIRAGWWLGDQASQAATGVASPGIMTATFASSLSLYSPLSIKLAGLDYTVDDNVEIPPGFLFVASAATRLIKLEAEDADSYTAASTVDATASGGDYMAFDDGEYIAFDLDTADITGGLIGVYAHCRQSSSSSQWALTTEIYRQGSGSLGRSAETVIATGLAESTPIRLGTLGRINDKFTLKITADALTLSPGTFQIDYIALIALGAPSEKVVGFRLVEGTDTLSTSYNVQIWVDHKYLDERQPRAYAEYTSGDLLGYMPYEGDIHLWSIGNTVKALYMAGTDWIYLDQSGGATTLTMTAYRRPVYLAPS